MNAAYRDILRHSAIYGLGQILTRLASFLLLPLFTSYLRPAGYRRIAALTGFTAAASFVTVEGLEIPYYVVLLGAGGLKLAGEYQPALATSEDETALLESSVPWPQSYSRVAHSSV